VTTNTTTKIPASLAEIRAVMAELPGPVTAAGEKASAREGTLTKPPGALGRLEELTQWLCLWQGRHPARIERPRVAVFAGNHGVAARGVSAYPAEVTKQMVLNFTTGGAAVNQLSLAADAELRVYEMELDNPTADFSRGAAMSEEDCAKAFAYGMMAVEPGIDLLCLGEMGIANTTSAAALCCALFGGGAREWVGPGTGVVGDALSRKIAVVDEAMKLHRPQFIDSFDIMRRVGGRELAAIAGAVMAARMARIPVLLDGFACTASAAVLLAADAQALDHCVVAHCSAEPGHRKLLERIGMKPLLDFGMRLGEASGAALAINILRSALACHNGMASFAEAGVSNKVD
jgi:nicotinate-nucleotide--dimethylbenzimidazole phosphoribosyltransferase